MTRLLNYSYRLRDLPLHYWLFWKKLYATFTNVVKDEALPPLGCFPIGTLRTSHFFGRNDPLLGSIGWAKTLEMGGGGWGRVAVKNRMPVGNL